MVALSVCCWLPSLAARGAVCTVPGTHPTIQLAVDDPSCGSIDLADQTFEESVLIRRGLNLVGVFEGQTTIQGQIVVTSQGSGVLIRYLAIESGCPDLALDIEEGADVQTSAIRISVAPGLLCPDINHIFTDGFESGDTSGWSASVP